MSLLRSRKPCLSLRCHPIQSCLLQHKFHHFITQSVNLTDDLPCLALSDLSHLRTERACHNAACSFVANSLQQFITKSVHLTEDLLCPRNFRSLTPVDTVSALSIKHSCQPGLVVPRASTSVFCCSEDGRKCALEKSDSALCCAARSRAFEEPAPIKYLISRGQDGACVHLTACRHEQGLGEG